MLRFIPPIAVLGVAAAICYVIFVTEPEPRKMPIRENLPEVTIQRLQPVDYQVLLKSQGTVNARTESTLVSEVRGKVTSIFPAFRAGGFFEEGEVLLEIDPRDYQLAVTIAEAALARARLALAEEEARAYQAKIDWERMNPNETATDLVLRQPQLNEAKANVAAAIAQLENARLDLERTRIAAPYAGRVLSKNADVGQFVSPGNNLASIYAVDYAEIRLPLNERQLSFFQIPEIYRDSNPQAENQPPVILTYSQGNQSYQWPARIVRSEGAFDTRSRQLFVIAQVDNPYIKQADNRPPLKVGSFVQAEIQGDLLKDVFVIPRELYRKNEYIVMIRPDDTLERREIVPLWADDENLIAREGFKAGDRVCLTPLRFPSDGMKVKVVGYQPPAVSDEVLSTATPPHADS